MSDWKEIEDVGKPYSQENGWCGLCGRCRENSEDLHEQDGWGEDD